LKQVQPKSDEWNIRNQRLESQEGLKHIRHKRQEQHNGVETN